MPVLIQLGVTTPILQNQVYALPTRCHYIVAVPNCELAQNESGPWVTMVDSSPDGFETAASFIRCATGPATITCKAI